MQGIRIEGSRILLTGAAGFIGSHLADRLLDMGAEVIGYDNLSGGNMDFLKKAMSNSSFTFIKGDVLDADALSWVMDGIDTVFHLAANPDVRLGESDSHVHFHQNVEATQNVIEVMRRKGVKNIVFTSTSTVYGEAEEIPTPESYGPTIPISLYGASKLASEAMISGFCHTYDMSAVIYRFANVVGPRSTHGVTYDFVNKLRKDPKKLVILGNGRQKKSYTHVFDTIDAMIFGVENRRERVEIFNMGSEDYIDVVGVADIVSDVMGLRDVEYEFTGGIGGAGWKGDVRVMQLSIEKLKRMGWRPKYDSAQSVRLTAEAIVSEL